MRKEFYVLVLLFISYQTLASGLKFAAFTSTPSLFETSSPACLMNGMESDWVEDRNLIGTCPVIPDIGLTENDQTQFEQLFSRTCLEVKKTNLAELSSSEIEQSYCSCIDQNLEDQFSCDKYNVKKWFKPESNQDLNLSSKLPVAIYKKYFDQYIKRKMGEDFLVQVGKFKKKCPKVQFALFNSSNESYYNAIMKNVGIEIDSKLSSENQNKLVWDKIKSLDSEDNFICETRSISVMAENFQKELLKYDEDGLFRRDTFLKYRGTLLKDFFSEREGQKEVSAHLLKFKKDLTKFSNVQNMTLFSSFYCSEIKASVDSSKDLAQNNQIDDEIEHIVNEDVCAVSLNTPSCTQQNQDLLAQESKEFDDQFNYSREDRLTSISSKMSGIAQGLNSFSATSPEKVETEFKAISSKVERTERELSSMQTRNRIEFSEMNSYEQALTSGSILDRTKALASLMNKKGFPKVNSIQEALSEIGKRKANLQEADQRITEAKDNLREFKEGELAALKQDIQNYKKSAQNNQSRPTEGARQRLDDRARSVASSFAPVPQAVAQIPASSNYGSNGGGGYFSPGSAIGYTPPPSTAGGSTTTSSSKSTAAFSNDMQNASNVLPTVIDYLDKRKEVVEGVLCVTQKDPCYLISKTNDGKSVIDTKKSIVPGELGKYLKNFERKFYTWDPGKNQKLVLVNPSIFFSGPSKN